MRPLRRLLTIGLLASLALVRPHAQVLAPSAFTLDGYYDLSLNGNDTTFMRSLTFRYVSGDLRFLTLTHTGLLKEFSLSGVSLNGRVGTTTNSWDLGAIGATKDFTGIWYEQATSRLFVTGSTDYTVEIVPAWVKTMTLNSNGTISSVHTINIGNVPQKRMYGGCRKIPTKWQAQFQGTYVCGWGGYTSLVLQGGVASIGPTLYAIPDPATVTEGATITAVPLLDASGAANRGYRQTLPLNYYDGGDPRPNPSTPPTVPPVTSAQFLSPNGAGKGWQVWGDSYYNNGEIILDTLVYVGAFCGVPQQSGNAGKCWYMDSTLNSDGRTAEWHTWDLQGIDGTNLLVRPTAMAEITLPRGFTTSFQGDTPVGNISGAAFDSTTNKMWLVGYPLGSDVYTGRLYRFTVNTGGSPVTPPGPPTPPSPTPIDCVGTWSTPIITTVSTCHNNQQTVTRVSTFTITTPAQYGGLACSNTNGQQITTTTTQSCSVPPPPSDPCVTSPLRITNISWPSSLAGASQLRYTTNYGEARVNWAKGSNAPDTLSITDSRGCTATVTR